jgi:biopolymer transport protein ExbD
MAMSGGRDDGQPMMDLNTTPLIDVMLVLLIMFIITIPIQTHAVKVDLPQNTPNNQTPRSIRRRTSSLSILPGRLLERCAGRQGGAASVSRGDRGMNPEPELHFQPDPAGALRTWSTNVLAIIKRSA